MQLLIGSWLLLLFGAVLAPVAGRRPQLAALIGCGSAVAGSLLGLIAAISSLATNSTLTLAVPLTIPALSFSLLLDGIASFFLIPVFLIGLACAVYGHEYMAGSAQRLPGLNWFFFNLLILSMTLVVTAANAILFLFAWECMSLSSFFLVTLEHEDRAVMRAGFIYLLATHLGAAFLFLFFLIAGSLGGSFEFSSFVTLAKVSSPLASTLFLLILIGFGSKAGLFPFHVWLPEAHPAAPSHVSALMSGVMVKTALYGIIRMLSFLPPSPPWWGGLLVGLGLTGALFGITMATSQKDIKRGLAYSTVENVGLIFLALGFWLYSRSTGQQLAANLALLGGLLHIWNHALFKSLLFLGAGSLLHGTGTRNLDRMGGLLRRMPVTGLCLFAGALAVAALPPFNGLVGEWFIYRGLLESGVHLQGMAGFFPLIEFGLMALIGGLVLMFFARFVGIALSGEPRHPQSAAAHEAGWRILAPMVALALLCLMFGLLPQMLIAAVGRTGILIDPALSPWLASTDIAPVWLGYLGWGALALVTLIVLLFRRRQSQSPSRSAATWGCGYALPDSRMSYSAEGFAELAGTTFFCECLQPRVGGGGALSLFPDKAVFCHKSSDMVLESLFVPLFDRISLLCAKIRHLQSGHLHVYIFYILIATILLLGWVVAGS